MVCNAKGACDNGKLNNGNYLAYKVLKNIYCCIREWRICGGWFRWNPNYDFRARFLAVPVDCLAVSPEWVLPTDLCVEVVDNAASVLLAAAITDVVVVAAATAPPEAPAAFVAFDEVAAVATDGGIELAFLEGVDV